MTVFAPVVTAVRLVGRGDCCSSHSSGISLHVGNSGTQADPVCMRDVDASAAGEIVCHSPLQGKYITAVANGHHRLVLCELQHHIVGKLFVDLVVEPLHLLHTWVGQFRSFIIDLGDIISFPILLVVCAYVCDRNCVRMSLRAGVCICICALFVFVFVWLCVDIHDPSQSGS